jgi:hypothetical protein
MVTIAVAGGAGPGYFYTPVLALWAVAVAFAGVQTIRLRRHEVVTAWFLDIWFRPIRPELIPEGKPSDKFFRPAWPARLAATVLLLCAFVLTLPNQVNAVAYLTGQAPTASFVPQFHSRQCLKKDPGNCTTYTTGIRVDTGAQVVYPGALATGQPVQVRVPLSWPPYGPDLLTAGSAEGYTFLGMLIDVTLTTFLTGFVVRWLGRRSPGRAGIKQDIQEVVHHGSPIPGHRPLEK